MRVSVTVDESAIDVWHSDTLEWSGYITYLMRNELDLLIGDFTRTPEREQVVDFTYPIHFDGVLVSAPYNVLVSVDLESAGDQYAQTDIDPPWTHTALLMMSVFDAKSLLVFVALVTIALFGPEFTSKGHSNHSRPFRYIKL